MDGTVATRIAVRVMAAKACGTDLLLRHRLPVREATSKEIFFRRLSGREQMRLHVKPVAARGDPLAADFLCPILCAKAGRRARRPKTRYLIKIAFQPRGNQEQWIETRQVCGAIRDSKCSVSRHPLNH